MIKPSLSILELSDDVYSRSYEEMDNYCVSPATGIS